MKLFPLLLLIILFLIVKIGSEKKKLQQKSFGEIFGEKWQEKEEEKRNEQKKREIVRKYYKIKEKIKQKGRKFSRKEWNKINSKIAKKLGTNRQYIQKWIKELGLNQKKCYKSTTEEQKIEIVKKFNEMSKEYKEKRKYSAKEWEKIEQKIAKKLGTNRNKIYEWIKELGLNQKINKTDDEKLEIIQKFIEMTNEYKQKGKYSGKEWHQNYAEICKKIGVNYGMIKKWKRKLGISIEKRTKKEKMEKMKIYWEIKSENPKISDKEIAKTLKIATKSISNWKKQFGEEMAEEEE